jgi:hypothetical protein
MLSNAGKVISKSRLAEVPTLVTVLFINISHEPGQLSHYSDRLWGCGWLGFGPAGAKDFSLFHSVQTGSGYHPASYPMGTGGSFHEGNETDHSPPSSAEVKNDGAIPPPPHTYSWCGAVLI